MKPKNDFISVIVAVKNEDRYIDRCLISLINQSLSHDFYQIVVVDGLSTDLTRHIIHKYIFKYPNLIKMYINEKEWQAAGRNLAIRNETSSNLVAYIDGHCIADREWLSILYHDLKSNSHPNLAGVGSTHFSPHDEPVIGRAIDQVFRSSFGGQGSSFKHINVLSKVITAPYILYRKSALCDVGLYDEDLKVGEDFALNYKLRKTGYHLIRDPKAIVYYYKRKSFSAFSKQMYNYGKAKAIIAKKYPGSVGFLHCAPPFFLVIGVIVLISTIFVQNMVYIIYPFFLTYIFSSFYFSIKGGMNEKDLRVSLFMIWLFAVQHFSYSLGFIIGFIKRGRCS